MQVIKLAGIILALSIEVLVDVILAQLLKAISGTKTAWLGSHGIMTTRKLHCLVGLTYSRGSTPVERPRNVDEEAGSQRLADIEARGPRARGPRDQARNPN